MKYAVIVDVLIVHIMEDQTLGLIIIVLDMKGIWIGTRDLELYLSPVANTRKSI